MENTKTKHIHFVGIGGSGISGISILAKQNGYEVSGCELEEKTDYLLKVKKAGIKVKLGHDASHLHGIDFLVVSPAILFQNSNHPEVVEAKKKGILLTWEEFLGKFIEKDKEVICVSGTHGKSTATAIAGLIFEKSNQDPSVVIGAKVKEWDANFRLGKSKLFLTEADEFNNNFLNYLPEAIVLNNIEFDHPDFFKSYDQVLGSFVKFIKKLSGKKILIVNQDNKGIRDVFGLLDSNFLQSAKVYGYTFEKDPLLKLENSIKIDIQRLDQVFTEFSIHLGEHQSHSYQLNIPGKFNIANATGIIILSKLYEVKDSDVAEVLKKFKGIGRRMDLIGEKRGIKIYDDYAHHPTAISETLKGLRQQYPENRIWAINEPHSYSRTKALLSEYKGVFNDADKVVIAPIFKARDKVTFGVSEADIANVSEHKNISVGGSFESILDTISMESKTGDIILVMGAGKSYKLAREILNIL